MKLKIRLIIVFLIFIGHQVKSQDIEKIADQICDAVSLVPLENKDSLEIIREQIDIQSTILQDSAVLLALTNGNVKNNLNVFNYKLYRTLIKNCPEYKITNFAIIGRTPILDVEGILTSGEMDSIENSARHLLKQKKAGLLIITIDDFYPFTNIDDYATFQGNNWHIGSEFEKGGIVLVISKSLRKVRISTSHSAQQFLTDIESQEIIDKTLIPKLKTGVYFQAILEFINDVKSKI